MVLEIGLEITFITDSLFKLCLYWRLLSQISTPSPSPLREWLGQLLARLFSLPLLTTGLTGHRLDILQ